LAKINVDVEVIVGQLRQIQNGANVHTINKAVFYLRSLSEPVWFFKDDAERIEQFNRLVINCQNAVKNKSATSLAIIMRRWF
jgi:hypothetical protein